MATPREIFEKDSSKNLRISSTVQIGNSLTGDIVEATYTVVFDFEAGVKYRAVFVGDTPLSIRAIAHFIADLSEFQKIADSVETWSGFQGTTEMIDSKELPFSNRLLAYTAFIIPEHSRQALVYESKKHNCALVLRDGAYLSARSVAEHPVAFISHDSRDKEPFVRKLAVTLQSMLCTVWYDEFSLIPGQSLRESIENGLKRCKKCILILSPFFLGNGGWTKAEFDSVFTREILEQKNIVIPVWLGVSKKDVYDYCPRLLDKVGIQADAEVEDVARKILRGVNYEG